jgi:hypothetical protein
MKLFSGGGGGASTSGFARARRSLNGLISAVMAVVILLTAGALWLRYDSAGRDAARNARNMSQVLAEYLGFRLAAVDGVLARLVATSRRLGGPSLSPREWGIAIRNSTSGVPGLSAVSVTNSEGTILYSTILQIMGVDWSGQPVFQKLKNGHPNLLTAAPPIQITGGDQILIPLGRQLTDPEGKFIGTAIATLVPNHLQDFDEAFDFGGSGVAWVLLPTGEVLFRQISGEVTDNAVDAARPEFAAAGLSAPEGVVSSPLVEGGPSYVTGYRRATNADLVVAVSLAKDDFMPGWRYEIAAALAFMALSGALLLFARQRILRAIGDAEADTAGPEAQTLATR